MAHRYFLSDEQVLNAKEILEQESKSWPHVGNSISKYLGECLQERLKAYPQFERSKPFRLGSWARDELCAKSDIDLLFVGDEKAVKQIVDDLQSDGLKVRYRMPKDLADWTIGVQPFDVLALLEAKPFFTQDQVLLNKQISKLKLQGQSLRNSFFRAIAQERQQRESRYDSIANYLEPNLKYGPGGLRDLDQGLQLAKLFIRHRPEIYEFSKNLISELSLQKQRIIYLRNFLHLHNNSDVLIGSIQGDLAKYLDFKNSQSMMTEVQNILSDVSFYSDTLAEVSQISIAQFQKHMKVPVRTFSESLRALNNSDSLLIQYRVRKNPPRLPPKKQIGEIISKFFRRDMSEDFVISLFRSLLLGQWLESLQRLKGWVQHDQYHRYSADAHTLQAVRTVLRCYKSPRLLGELKSSAKVLTSEDWNVLLWTALFHDLGKGLSGDHSTEGEALTKKEFISSGMSLALTRQVSWMVKNHLLLSGAAFRQNPNDPGTWVELFRRGLKGRRIERLAVFTAIDIIATNPEAWNDWKERLLSELVAALNSAGATHVGSFLEWAEKRKINIDKTYFEKMDLRVLSEVSKSVLAKDYKLVRSSKISLPPLIVKSKTKKKSEEYWLRFHSINNQPGLFLNYVSCIYNAGGNILHSAVHTDEVIGVYDWFKIKSNRKISQLTSLLNIADNTMNSIINLDLDVKFDVIEVVSRSEDSLLISFRGKDQRGALLSAAKAIYDVGFDIVSARVHTWGRQIDDVFTVRRTSSENWEVGLQKIYDHLLIHK